MQISLYLFTKNGGQLGFRFVDHDGFNGCRFEQGLKAVEKLIWGNPRRLSKFNCSDENRVDPVFWMLLSNKESTAPASFEPIAVLKFLESGDDGIHVDSVHSGKGTSAGQTFAVSEITAQDPKNDLAHELLANGYAVVL